MAVHLNWECGNLHWALRPGPCRYCMTKAFTGYLLGEGPERQFFLAHKVCAEVSLERIAAGLCPPDPDAPPLTDRPVKRRVARVPVARRARPAARPQPQLFPGT